MAISTFASGGVQYGFHDVAALVGQEAYSRLPYIKRVIAENLMRGAGRHQDVGPLIEALIAQTDGNEVSLPLSVPRIILPDSSGIPVLMDLAALRTAIAERGGDPGRVTSQVPIDFIVDHSLQVDLHATPGAEVANLNREFERNAERYAFLKWAQGAFGSLRVYPPGSGIIHQINLEQIAEVTRVDRSEPLPVAYPDFCIGGDSHTPMVNALGVMGWGVGGIEAETAALGQYYIIPSAEFVGVRLSGKMRPGITMTDTALTVTKILREAKVVGAFLEFFGPAAADLSVPDRATLANMAPEYGATTGFWPVDHMTLDYLRLTGRPEAQVELVADHARAAGLLRTEGAEDPVYDRVVEIDLSQVEQSISGPGKPHFRIGLGDLEESFFAQVGRPERAKATSIPDGAVALAAITSCTNTANPEGMIRAGLLARNAMERGLRPKSWVKTSLAPGSRAVTAYLDDAGLMPALEGLGFGVVGYGCTTCGGKSGPLREDVSAAVENEQVKVAAVLSGNRNFDGRIHRQIQASYLCSPALVVAYALAGTVLVDLDNQPLGTDSNGQPVHLADLWPRDEDVAELVAAVVTPSVFRMSKAYNASTFEGWQAIEPEEGALFPWARESTYIVEPPFFRETAGGPPASIAGARVLGVYGDGLTTDHISPSGEIPANSPAGQYLMELGIKPPDFNTYVGRRGNHHVMARGTYANLRLRNELVPGMEGWWTRIFPDDEVVEMFEASQRYRERGIPSIVLAGRDFGSGSSRDWAAKGPALLGIKAVLAQSFERIHRSNMICLGIVPLLFEKGQSRLSLGLTGEESFDFAGLEQGVSSGDDVEVTARSDRGRVTTFSAKADIRSEAETRLMLDGGIFQAALSRFAALQ